MKESLSANRVVLEGEWDLTRKNELTKLLAPLSRDGNATVDIRDVTYVDSTTLGVLAGLLKRLQGTTITLLGPQPQILRLLKIVNFDRLFRIIDRE